MMRHQYFLAIESSQSAGWYQLEVRTKRRGFTVRARTGYFAGERPRASRVSPRVHASDRASMPARVDHSDV